MKLNTIILAAGMGKRLQSETCKVVVPLMGKPLILHLLDNISNVISKRCYIVVGHCAQDVNASFRELWSCPIRIPEEQRYRPYRDAMRNPFGIIVSALILAGMFLGECRHG